MAEVKFLKPGDPSNEVARVFGTPVVTKGMTWLPAAEVVAWGVLAWYAGKRQPQRTWLERLGVSALTMPVVLGSEWCHNLAHAAAAQMIGKPMDALLVNFGMPLVIYYDIEDENVKPREHIIRALGGPIANASLLAVWLLIQRLSRPGSLRGEIADIGVGTNAFLSTISLLPIPGIDGGPILKWSLVERGQTTEQADESVRKVNGVLSLLLAIVSGALLKRRKRLLGGFLAMLAAVALAVWRDLIRES